MQLEGKLSYTLIIGLETMKQRKAYAAKGND
jgi:hypothetical protein